MCFPCSHIVDTPVTEREFLEQLHELNHKINFVKEQSFKETRSSNDVRDILEKLKFKVGTSSIACPVQDITALCEIGVFLQLFYSPLSPLQRRL